MKLIRLILIPVGLALIAAAPSALADPIDEPEPSTTTVDESDRVVTSEIYFAFDSAALSETAQRELDEAAKWLIDNPTEVIVVEGHADNVGEPAYNKALSEKRAEAAKQYLVDAGVEAERIRVLPYGEAAPAVEVPGAVRQNRRIQLFAVHKEPKIETKLVTVKVPEVVPKTVYVDREILVPVKPAPEPPMEIAVSAGGGVVQSLDGTTRDLTDVGGLWNVRVLFGTNSTIGTELSYVGSARDIDSMAGLDDDAAMLGNGAQAAMRLNLWNRELSPYLYGGVGWTHYTIVNDDQLDSDNVAFLPMGVGVTWRATEDLRVDLRATARAAFGDELFDTMTPQLGAEPTLDDWSAAASVGWEL